MMGVPIQGLHFGVTDFHSFCGDGSVLLDPGDRAEEAGTDQALVDRVRVVTVVRWRVQNCQSHGEEDYRSANSMAGKRLGRS